MTADTLDVGAPEERYDILTALLAVLIAFVQVAGPLLCRCCPAAQSPVAVTDDSRLDSDSCCPHCCPSKPKHAPTKSCPLTPHPGECCVVANSPTAVSASVEAEWSRLMALGGQISAPTSTLTVALADDILPWHDSSHDLPFLTKSDRLYAHHALRC